MKLPPVRFSEANQYIGQIVLVGICLGIGGYAMGFWPTLGQSLVQHILISLIVGYSLIWIIFNSRYWFSESISPLRKNGILVGLFVLTGLIGAEADGVIRAFLFQQGPYRFFGTPGASVFNAMLSIVLGYGMDNWTQPKLTTEPEESTPAAPPLTTIPIRQGETTSFHPLQKVLYFEAYDNYSFLFDTEGNRFLCNYSLLFLEKKLAGKFVRVHRKYLINKNHIRSIKPHLKGRFVIEFADEKKSSVTSSNSYSAVVKSLTKL